MNPSLKVPFLFLLFLFLCDTLKSQCTVTSSNGWTATITITPVDVIPSTMNCPWFYHYEVQFDYDIVFTGSTSNRSLNAQIYFNCTGGGGGQPYVDIGNFTGNTSGTATTGNNARQYSASGGAYNYGSNPSCTTIELGDVGCSTYSLSTYGNGVASNSQTCQSNNSTLPIQLLRFQAIRNQNDVTLNWVTATETNNDFFTVERSADGEQWEAIVFVEGAGNSTEMRDYLESDNLPMNQSAYYRLKQTDFDGTSTYSEVVYLKAGLFEDGLSLYPVPADDVLTINNCDQLSEVTIYNLQGEQMRADLYQNERCTVQTSELASGVYILVGHENGLIVSKRFTVAR